MTPSSLTSTATSPLSSPSPTESSSSSPASFSPNVTAGSRFCPASVIKEFRSSAYYFELPSSVSVAHHRFPTQDVNSSPSTIKAALHCYLANRTPSSSDPVTDLSICITEQRHFVDVK